MAEYEKAVRKILQENGCYFVREARVDHSMWYSPITNRQFPVDGKIKSRHMANIIMKQSGIKHKF